MNKSLKAKNLPLFSIIDLDQLRRENHLEGTEVTDFFTARDGKVYLLMEQPSETQGKDWLSTPSTYTAVEIQLDWAEQRVLETTLFPLGLLKFQFHYLRPAGDHFLLLGARCAYRENGPDQNAWIVSRDGTVLSRFCLGDGIQDCVVKKDGTIITSYFDEGVFGNYGWDEPLGGRMRSIPSMTAMPSAWTKKKTCGSIITMNSGWCGRPSKRILCLNCQSKEAELFLLPRLVILFCFRAGIRNITNSTSLPLMVIALGKSGRLFPPVMETRSLWSSAACFAARCCSSGKTAFSMAGYLVKARNDNG